MRQGEAARTSAKCTMKQYAHLQEHVQDRGRGRRKEREGSVHINLKPKEIASPSPRPVFLPFLLLFNHLFSFSNVHQSASLAFFLQIECAHNPC